jgi:hypothetical protein
MKAKSKRLPAISTLPSEAQEQAAVVRWLTWHGILFCAVPNGGKRHIVTAKRLAAEGVRPGVPDLLIFDPVPCPARSGASVGVALEMKRQRGGRLSPEQKVWMAALEVRGWSVCVACGADAAIKALEALGYGRAKPWA